MLAGRGVALLITEGFITTVTSAPYKFIATGYVVGLPFALFISVAAIVGDRAGRAANRARRAHRSGGHQPRGESPRRRALARHHLRRLRRQRPAGGHGRHPLQLEHHGRRRQRDRPLHRALRDPRGRARRNVAHGRQVHDRRNRRRRLHHPDAEVDDPLPRRSRRRRRRWSSPRSSSSSSSSSRRGCTASRGTPSHPCARAAVPVRRPGRRRRHDRERADPHPPRGRRRLAATAPS